MNKLGLQVKSWLQAGQLPIWALSLCIIILAAYAFPGSGQLVWLWGPLLLFGLAKALEKLLLARKEAQEEKDFSYFLSYLASAVTAGRNLELSLAEAAQKLEGDLPAKSRVYQTVQQLSLSIYAGVSLRQALEDFAQHFPQASLRTFAQVLATLVEKGGRYEIFLELQRDALQKKLELEAELNAELAASLTEASIMAVLPFGLSWVLNQSSYLNDLAQLPVWPYLQSGFLTLALLGLILALRMIREGLKKPPFPDLKLPALPGSTGRQSFCRAWANFVARAYPPGLHRQILRDLESFGPDTQRVWTQFAWQKFQYGLAGLGLSLLLTRSPVALGLAFLAFCYPDARLREGAKSLARSEQAEYPAFLNLLAILLESSLSLERSLTLTLICLLPSSPQKTKSQPRGLWPQKKSQLTVLQHDLLEVRQELESGLGAVAALENLAEKRRQAEIAQTLRLITRYAREGSDHQVALLRVQAQRTQDHYRNAMREQLAKKGLHILLPMTFDLILIIAISALPALLQLQI